MSSSRLMKSIFLRLAIILVPLVVALAQECSEERSADDVVSQLLNWLHENGAYINEKVAVRHLVPGDSLSPRGIFATDDMDVGETVCRIPWNLILKPRDKEMVTIVGKSNCTSGTIEAVADAMSSGGKTPYGAYLLAQPKDYTAAFWSQAARDLLHEMLLSKRSNHLTELDQLPPRGIDDLIDDEIKLCCNGRVNDPLFRQAAMLVMARADFHYMVPFYDMNNHHNGKRNMAHRYNPYDPIGLNQIKQTGYELVTTKAVKQSEQLYTSYNRGVVSKEYVDWFGTPEMFLQFGFVEELPQRWLFDFARVKFDLVWSDAGTALLREELTRLTLFAKHHRHNTSEDTHISLCEWSSLWQYYDALHYALSSAVQQSSNGYNMTDDAWKLDENWWVKDGTITSDDDDHKVYPTINA
ncbi:hypothetical protein ACHAW5_005784 [Stephanodiscus triporus]|uniref:SET domain-containing protein n=1 Tax=Stephanodiscus triporus TaxID=2934178 RepID=A0ABD3PTF6_9STRA